MSDILKALPYCYTCKTRKPKSEFMCEGLCKECSDKMYSLRLSHLEQRVAELEKFTCINGVKKHEAAAYDEVKRDRCTPGERTRIFPQQKFKGDLD